MIECIGFDFGGNNVFVDLGVMMLLIDGVVENVDVCNVILVMKVGCIVDMVDIIDGNWVLVNVYDFSLKMDENIYVLGDVCV